MRTWYALSLCFVSWRDLNGGNMPVTNRVLTACVSRHVSAEAILNPKLDMIYAWLDTSRL